MSISSPGIGSGIDINSLITGLVSAEGSAKSSLINIKDAKYQAEISAFGSLKAALADFQVAAQSLQDISSFQQRSVSSSDITIFTATADETAVSGDYDVEVVQLAKAHKSISGAAAFSSATDTVGSGTLKLTQNGSSFTITVSATDTLEDVRDAINNAEDNTGVSAVILNVDDGVGGTESKLVISSTKTGLDNTVTLEVDEDGDLIYGEADELDNTGLSRLSDAQMVATAAVDGQIKIDGQLISSSNDTFASAIDGLSITAVSVGAGESLSVSLNESGLEAKVNSFVKSYNELMETVNSLSSYDSETKTAGTLLGDSVLRSVQSSIRNLISSEVDGVDSRVNTLASIGVTTQRDGTFVVDSDKLSTAIEENFDQIGEFFASDNGLANKLDTLIENYVNSAGILDSRTDGLGRRITDLAEQRTALAIRLTSLESRLLAQFTAMDTLVNNLQSQSSFLSQQLASLPGAIDPNK